MPFHHTVLAHIREGWAKHKKKIFIISGSTTVLVLIVVGGSFAYVKAFEGKIYPNVSIGTVAVGGMTEAQASEAIQAAMNSMLDRGLAVRFDNGEENRLAVIDLRSGGSTDPDLVYDLINLNVDDATQRAYDVGRGSGNIVLDTWNAFATLVREPRIQGKFTIASTQIEDAIRTEFSDVQSTGTKTHYAVDIGKKGIDVVVEEGEAGYDLNIEGVLVNTAMHVQDFYLPETKMDLIESPVVSQADAETLVDDVIAAVEAAPYELTYTSDAQRDYSWTISDDQVAEWIIPVKNDDSTLTLSLDQNAMESFFEDIHADVDVAPQNARFQMEDGRVVEFAGSLDGATLDEEKTINAIAPELGVEDTQIAIAVETVSPDISTESVNSLGITEIVGVGVSNFRGSPSNRISNIKHGAAKLNGLLIAPGEEFSLLEALKPFTIEDGWLPELVIKGDEIKPEVGGGACQFGTTLFRASMNSGLNVTERRNHSLVVSYYNDPSNNNPGTDATIYDPAPDFKFINDTENYLLLTTEVDMSKTEMVFTFWGTSDGRQGSYTPPQVLSWTSAGSPVTKETDSLAPGQKQCQSAHPGAVTSFDYNVTYANGETFSHTYTSTYRALPQTCLVGKAAESTPAPTTDTPTDTPIETTDPVTQ